MKLMSIKMHCGLGPKETCNSRLMRQTTTMMYGGPEGTYRNLCKYCDIADNICDAMFPEGHHSEEYATKMEFPECRLIQNLIIQLNEQDLLGWVFNSVYLCLSSRLFILLSSFLSRIDEIREPDFLPSNQVRLSRFLYMHLYISPQNSTMKARSIQPSAALHFRIVLQ